MGIPASPFGCTDLNITVFRLPPVYTIAQILKFVKKIPCLKHAELSYLQQ